MSDRPWYSGYDRNVPHQLTYPDQPLHRFLEVTAREHPDRPCTIFKGAVLTYGEVDELSDRLAARLVEMGLKKGQPVGLFMPNIPPFVIAFYAVLRAGGVVVATNPLYTPRELEHQLNDSGVEIMIVMSRFYRKVKDVQSKTRLRTIVVTNIKEYLPPVLRFAFGLTREKKEGDRVTLEAGDAWFQDLLAEPAAAAAPLPSVGPEDVALYQYSGGTTGLSKAAVALHRNLVANTLQIAAWHSPIESEHHILLLAVPLFHVYGMVAGMSFAVQNGATMVLVPNTRDLPDLLQTIHKYRPTIFPHVPAIYNAINHNADVAKGKYKLDSIRACVSGSAPLLPETKEKFEKLSGGKLVEGFGMSEAPTATHCNPLQGENRSGSIGLPLPDVDCRIVSLEDGMTVLPIGQEGELVIRGPNVMKGYLNMPTETANTLRDGWLYTGDTAKMDADGYFYIVGRKKELIKPGGFQVWPREVEEVIAEHPKVLEVGVAGIADAERGELVKAWVVPKPGETVTEAELRAWCKEKLAPYKVPTRFEFRTELPKTTVGKVLRRELIRQEKEHDG
ncbi:MAG: long-chain fatty acid--CoA ligase [Anaerolineales bacterium]